MKKRVASIVVVLLAFASIVFAGGRGISIFTPSAEVPAQPEPEAPQTSGRKKNDFVFMKSDEGWQMEHNGRKIMVVVGNFAAYHNGTVITADSAVRYSERHIECFGKVLINRGTTYIYGDRAEYNGNTNVAKVYSKIVKVVDGDATLYTYNFTFNTKRNVGHYTGGGVLICKDNMIESDRGYLYSDKDEIVCVDRVQMRNDDYEMMGDSVVYNTETDYAQFFTRTNLWNKGKNNKEDDYLYADRGSFDKAKQLYKLTKNGYILTKDQELMCDSLDYYREKEYALLRRNIQIDDRSHKVLMFGDWGEYWKEPGNVFVTKRPSLISYDTSESDSVFVCSDSMYLFTYYPIREKMEKEKARKDSLARAAKATAEKGAKPAKAKGAGTEAKNNRNDELLSRKEKRAEAERLKDSLEQAAKQDTLPHKEHSGKPRRETPMAAVADSARVVATETVVVKKSKAELRRAMIDSLASDTTARGKKLRAKLIREEALEVSRAAEAAVKEELRQKKAAYKAMLAERNVFFKKLLGEAKVREAEAKRLRDSLAKVAKLSADSVKIDSVKLDTVKVETPKVDTMKVDTTKVDTLKADSVKIDTMAKFDTMTVKQLRDYFKAKRDKEIAEEKRIKEDSLNAKLDRIGRARQAKRAEQYRKWEIRDSIYMAKAKLREDEHLRRKFARMERRGKYVVMADSATLAKVDSIVRSIYGPLYKEVNYNLDSILHILYPESIPEPEREVERPDSMNVDSLYREIRALGRVKFFRSDVQSVCDSLVTTTLDSIINMYKGPVMWNGSNQITSEAMHLHTHKSQLVKADFKGNALMAAEIDTAHYNQVAGKEMTSLFRNQEIYRNDVNGNVQTIYFMQEDNSPEITLMAYIEAGDMTSYIEKQEVVAITYRGNPAYTFFPIDKIPATQPTKLQNFKWEMNRRPTQDSIFTRTIRPSVRIQKRALRRPSFPINTILEQRKRDYIRRREWQDRNDVVSVETKEWIKTLK